MSNTSSRNIERPTVASGVVVPRQATLGGRILARTIYLLISAVGKTLRFRHEDEASVREHWLQGPVIFAIWHNRLALSLLLYHRYVLREQPHRRMTAIASASRDGGMLARTIELFGVRPVRGSSSRRGAQALLEMARLAEQGYDLAVTPDGPRGPRYRLQPGVVGLAAATGMPIVLACCEVVRKKELKTWDRFQIPLPFSEINVSSTERIYVPRNPSSEEREAIRADLERRMLEITVD